MAVDIPRPVLKSHKALVIGIANEHSIAYGCAKAFRELGADLAITYLNDKARPHVETIWAAHIDLWHSHLGPTGAKDSGCGSTRGPRFLALAAAQAG